MVKLHAAEHARIGENEGVLGGDEDEVIVFLRDVARGFGAKFPAHPEVQAEPAVAREAKQHLLRRCLGALESGLREVPAHEPRISAAEDSGTIMREHTSDNRAAGGEVPALPVEFGFSELGHKITAAWR